MSRLLSYQRRRAEMFLCRTLRAHSIDRISLLWIRIKQAEQLKQLVLNQTAMVPADSVCHLLIRLYCTVAGFTRSQIQWIWIWIRSIERTDPDPEQPNMTNRTRPYMLPKIPPGISHKDAKGTCTVSEQ